MGSKSGFSKQVFRAFGLNQMEWHAILLNDMDPVCLLLAMPLTSPALRVAVARVIRSWIPCPRCLPDLVEMASRGGASPNPEMCSAMSQGESCDGCTEGTRHARALWESIRKAPPADDLVTLIAQALFLQSRSFQLKPVTIEGGRWLEYGWKPEIDQQFRQRDGEVVNEDSPRWTVAERHEALPGRWVESGFKPEWEDHSKQGLGLGSAQYQHPRWLIAGYVEECSTPGTCQIGISRLDALEFVRGLELTSSDVLILDPPYLETTGYGADSSRADVLEIARIGKAAGALVILHEAVGLAGDLGPGWHQRCGSPLRARGSTFHKGGIEREWLTANREPVWWPAQQQSLFGG